MNRDDLWSERPRVLVVDDEHSVRHVVSGYLTRKGCDVHAAGSSEEALGELESVQPEVALVDIVMPGRSGIALLDDLKRHPSDPEVVLMTSHGSVETAIAAIRSGAYDYLQKPFDQLDDVWTIIQRALARRRLRQQTLAIAEQPEEGSCVTTVESTDPVRDRSDD